MLASYMLSILLWGIALAAPSLEEIRAALVTKEDQIIHLALTRCAAPLYGEFTASPLLNSLSQAARRGTSSPSDSSFPGHPPFPPYIDATPSHARWGAAQSNLSSQSIVDYWYKNMLPASSAAHNQTGYFPEASPALAMSSAAFFETVSQRIGFGEEVAQAKLAANHSAFGEHIRRHDAVAIRKLLTDERQEQLVKQRVGNKTQAWQVGAAQNVPAAVLVDLFASYIIPWTTDVEVATLLMRGQKQ